jgi:hypothetical protein
MNIKLYSSFLVHPDEFITNANFVVYIIAKISNSIVLIIF